MKDIYVVLTRIGQGWQNVWESGDEDRAPMWFESRQAAEAELDDHLAEAREAGWSFPPEDFRIVKVSHTHEHWEA
jgi:hypothetical protein